MTDRAAIYLRVSSQRQAGEDRASLPVQIEQCTRYCNDRGWEIVATAEDHESGKNVSRSGYQQLLELARGGRVQHIVVFAGSRLGRDAPERIYRRRELDGLGLKLHSCTDNIEDSFSHDIMAVIDEHELRRIQSRIAPAKRYKAERGFYVGSRLPFGTQRVKVADPEANRSGNVLAPGQHFDIVRLIFQLASEGYTISAIGDRVNAAIEPRVLDRYDVRYIIFNTAYIGRTRWQDLDVKAQWEPMIDVDLFRRAGEAVKGRYRQRVNLSPETPRWLLGLVHCGVCGARMVSRSTVTPRGTHYPYIVCGKRNRGQDRGCEGRESKNVNLDHVQDWLLEQLQQTIVTSGPVLQRLESYANARRDELTQRLQGITSERARLQERVRRAQAAHLDDPAAFSIADVAQLRRLADDTIAAGYEEADALQRSLSSTEDYEALRSVLEGGAWLEARLSDPAAFRTLLSRFIQRVDVYSKDRFEVVYASALRTVAVR